MLPWSNDLKLLFLDAKLPPELEEFRRLFGDFIPQTRSFWPKLMHSFVLPAKTISALKVSFLKKLNKSCEERLVIWQNNVVFE